MGGDEGVRGPPTKGKLGDAWSPLAVLAGGGGMGGGELLAPGVWRPGKLLCTPQGPGSPTSERHPAPMSGVLRLRSPELA